MKKENILNSAFNPPRELDNKDGIALTSIEHPPDFPWNFVHKLINVSKRKSNKSDL